jgi:hypothetical protein
MEGPQSATRSILVVQPKLQSRQLGEISFPGGVMV